VASGWLLKRADKRRSPEMATSRGSSIAQWLEETIERQFDQLDSDSWMQMQ
jgi:hypothetical protein